MLQSCLVEGTQLGRYVVYQSSCYTPPLSLRIWCFVTLYNLQLLP